jgi:hypothetical protein
MPTEKNIKLEGLDMKEEYIRDLVVYNLALIVSSSLFVAAPIHN